MEKWSWLLRKKCPTYPVLARAHAVGLNLHVGAAAGRIGQEHRAARQTSAELRLRRGGEAADGVNRGGGWRGRGVAFAAGAAAEGQHQNEDERECGDAHQAARGARARLLLLDGVEGVGLAVGLGAPRILGASPRDGGVVALRRHLESCAGGSPGRALQGELRRSGGRSSGRTRLWSW